MVFTVGEEPDPAKRIRLKQAALIKQYRLFAGLTQLQLAERIGVTHAAVSQWERGLTTPKQHLQVELVKALNCPWGAIFGLDR